MQSCPMPIRHIAAHYVLTPRGFLRGGMITIDREGTVIDVLAPTDLNFLQQVEFYNGILIPGMVNAHTHLELSYLKGVIPEGGGFAGFAKGLRENRSRFSRDEIEHAIDYNAARMWADGVQAVGDICNGDSTFPFKTRSPLRSHSFVELFGLNAGIREAERAEMIREEAVGAGLRATVTPHATYSLNEEGFRFGVGDDDNSPLSIHFMESPGETELFEDRGEMKRWYDDAGFRTDFTPLYNSPAERVVALVPSTRKVLLVHNTMIGQDEISVLKDHFGDNVTFVLCPRSNRYITGMAPPAELLRKNKVRVAVGTDSLASNHSLSMIDELKTFGSIPLEELLRWATIGGAEALGLQDTLGSFEKGKRPGVVLLEGVDWSELALTPEAETRRIV